MGEIKGALLNGLPKVHLCPTYI